MNQRENLQGAILKRKAQIAEITHTLNQPLTGIDPVLGLPCRVSTSGRQRLREKMLHQELIVADLEAQLSRMDHPSKAEATPPIEVLRDPKTMGRNIEKYMHEAKWTRGQLAADAGFDEKSVRAHLSGTRIMRPSTEEIYEEVFLRRLKRKVSLRNYTPPT
jgi:hypothetical protein